MSRRLDLTIAVVGLLALTSCSSDDEKAAVTTSTAVTTTVADTTSTTSTPPTTSVPVSADTVPPDDTEPDDGLVVHESVEGGYTVVFPGEPVANEVPIPNSNAVGHAMVWEDDNGAFLVNYVDFPGDEITAPAPELLRAAAEAFVGSVGVSDVEYTDVELDGHPGVRAVGASADTEVDAVVYLVDTRMFQVIYLGAPGARDPLAIDVFHRSFTLTEATP